MPFLPDDVQEAYDAGRNLDPAAVGTQVVLMTAASFCTVIAFNYLRPKNKIIYQPKVKYHDGNKPPPKISDSLFGWLPPLIHTKESELLDKIGLDAVTFLRFLRLLRSLFSATALLTCGILIPINVTYNLDHVKPKKRDALSMLTIRDVKGERLFIHVGVSYLITFVFVFMVYIFWRDMVRLRHAWFRSPEYSQAFYARTLSILHVPKKHQSDEGLSTILNSIKMPYPATSVHIGRKVGHLPELIEYHNQTVREFEGILVKYLKGGRIASHRPTIRIGGFCGFGGIKKDAIDFYTAKLKRTEAAVEDYRASIGGLKAENYGFASLAAIPYAHFAAKKLLGKHAKGTTITLAPNPKDIIWANMNKSEGALRRRSLLGWLWLAAICFLSLIPLFLVAILANLNVVSATGYLPFLESWVNDAGFSFALVSGVVPPLVSGLFTLFLPRMMRWLTRYMGALTHARLDRAVIQRYFAFLVISQLIVFTLIGVAFNSTYQIVILIGKHATARKILDNLNKLPSAINKTYINQASFWLKYVPFRGFLVVFDLAQVINLLWVSFKTRVFGRTPRDIREWTQPPEFEYAIYYSNLLFLAAIGFLFAPLAPLVALAAAIVFWLSSWVYKYQLMYVFVTKVETGGQLWNVVINRLIFCMMLMHALMVLTIGLQFKFQSWKWLSTVPPFFIVLFFKVYLNYKFDEQFRFYLPTEEELQHAKVHSSRGDHRAHKLENRFGHPALHAELFTPMLHAKMLPLLKQVYDGKIDETQTKLDEFGGQKVETREVAGIRIAAVDQSALEYDPILYQRDRGDDLDRQSISSSTLLSPSILSGGQTPSIYGPGFPQSSPQGISEQEYQNYLTSGHTSPRPPSLVSQSYFEQSSQQVVSPGLYPVQHPTRPSSLTPPGSTRREPSQALSWYSVQDIAMPQPHHQSFYQENTQTPLVPEGHHSDTPFNPYTEQNQGQQSDILGQPYGQFPHGHHPSQPHPRYPS